ncbi:MAG: 50S ribosomal protein L25 [Phycisphaerales bacterium]|nr:50S ribosomal protein L25 [Phycisphaerales bacterium]
MEVPILKCERRTRLGTHYTRRLRAKGQLPGIIYGHGEAPEAFSVEAHALQLHLDHGARVLNLEMEGQTKACLIKDVQRDHLDRDPIHVDMARVNLDERVRVEVAIELRGTPKGVEHGGILELMKDTVLVECLAMNIPDTFHPTVTELEVGDVLHVKDLKLPEGVVILDDPNERLAMVRALAAEVDAATVVAEEGAPEPERIGRVAPTEEAEGEEK